MSAICPCGKLATHRVRWNPVTDISEPIRSTAPSRCYACTLEEAARATAQGQAEKDYTDSFPEDTKLVYRSDVPVPHMWTKLVRQACRRHGYSINPGGYIIAGSRHAYLFVDLYPPKGQPDTWDPEHCLYLLRYLTKLPLVLVPVPRDESPFRAIHRESSVLWRSRRQLAVLQKNDG